MSKKMREKFIRTQTYLKIQECTEQSNFISKGSRKRRRHSSNSLERIIKNREEINEIKTIKMGMISHTNSWFFEKTNKIGKPLLESLKKNREAEVFD